MDKTRIDIRLTVKEKNRIATLAKVYANDNMSKWIVYSALNAPRKFLNKKPKKHS